MSDDEENGDQDMDYPPASSAAAAAASSSAAAAADHIDLTDEEVTDASLVEVSQFKESWDADKKKWISNGGENHCFFNCMHRAFGSKKARTSHGYREVIALIDLGIAAFLAMVPSNEEEKQSFFESSSLVISNIAQGIRGESKRWKDVDYKDIDWTDMVRLYKERTSYARHVDGGMLEAQLITLGTPDILIWCYHFRVDGKEPEWIPSNDAFQPSNATQLVYLFHMYASHWDIAEFTIGSGKSYIVNGDWVRANDREFQLLLDAPAKEAKHAHNQLLANTKKRKKSKPPPKAAAAASSSSSPSHAPQPPTDSSAAAASALLQKDISELSLSEAEEELDELIPQLTSGEAMSLPGFQPRRTHESRAAAVNSTTQGMRRNQVLEQLDAARRIIAEKQRAAGGAGNYRPLRRRHGAAAAVPSSLQVYDNASFTPSSTHDFDESKPLWAIYKEMKPDEVTEKAGTELNRQVPTWSENEKTFGDLRKLIALKVHTEGEEWVNRVFSGGLSIVHYLADSISPSDASVAKMLRWLKNNTAVDIWKKTREDKPQTAHGMASYKRRWETVAFIESVPNANNFGAAEARAMIVGHALEEQRKRRHRASASSTSPDRSAAAENKRSRKDGAGAEVAVNSGIEVIALRDRNLAELFNRDDSTAAETPRLVGGLVYVGPEHRKKQEKLCNTLHTYFYPNAYAGESADVTEVTNRQIGGWINSDNSNRKSRVDNSGLDPGMALWNEWSRQVHKVPPLDMAKSVYYKNATHAGDDPQDLHFRWRSDQTDELGTGTVDVDAFLMWAVHANLRVNGMETIVQQARLNAEVEAEKSAMYWNSVAAWFYSRLDSIKSNKDSTWEESAHRASLLKGLIAFVQSPEANARQRRILLYRKWFREDYSIRRSILTKYVDKRPLAKPSALIETFEAAADAAAARSSSSSSSSPAAPWSWSAASAVAALPSSSSRAPLPLISAPSSAAAAAPSWQSSHRTRPQTAAASSSSPAKAAAASSSSAAAAASSSAPAPFRAAPVPEKSIEEIKAMRAADREERARLKAILLSK